ncbi:hypothetical protein [Bacillus sp. V59.32b]|uniref:hypothetical protein n=1 Tax=Bacillus sp. V59.32b TaxID=1758642 RepID=UPI000E3ED3AB|nr:hypothetical protein [Bacillus sp. V59.32b]RFU68414.1 hypothetical protein D0463_05180 [Bacillus sp. V59.32b]
MPYHKNKQQAFQAVQQGVKEAVDVYSDIERDDADYGGQLSHLKQEVNEAFQQIENALENASEHQRVQLEEYLKGLKNILKDSE